jgi:hypothetical protein
VKPRLTQEVDIALVAEDPVASRERAEAVLRALGHEIALGWIASSRVGDPVALVIGRPPRESSGTTVDFLLPSLPWVEPAVERAQDDLIDFGFARVPTVTPEDIIVAKTFALTIEPRRFQDMDDTRSILVGGDPLDLAHVVREFRRLDISLPPALHADAPEVLRR